MGLGAPDLGRVEQRLRLRPVAGQVPDLCLLSHDLPSAASRGRFLLKEGIAAGMSCHSRGPTLATTGTVPTRLAGVLCFRRRGSSSGMIHGLKSVHGEEFGQDVARKRLFNARCWEHGKPHAKECKWRRVCPLAPNPLQTDRSPRSKTETTSYLEENAGARPTGLGLREDVMNLTPKARGVKVKQDEWDAIKLKSF